MSHLFFNDLVLLGIICYKKLMLNSQLIHF